MLPFLVLAATPNCACGLMFCSDTATIQPRLLIVADRDAAFVRKILDGAQRHRKKNVRHHSEADDLGRTLTKRVFDFKGLQDKLLIFND